MALPAATSQIMTELPNGWSWFRLGDHTRKIGSGATPRGGQTSYVAESIPLIRSQNVWMMEFDREGLAHITDERDAALSNSRVEPGFRGRQMRHPAFGASRSLQCETASSTPMNRSRYR